MRCLVFGGSGLLGSELWPLLMQRGYPVAAPPRQEVDCRDAAQVRACMRAFRPDAVIVAAAKVGGILANMRHGAEYLFDNAMINLTVLKACADHQVPRALVFGSSCMYPRAIDRAIVESDLLAGQLEATSEGYAVGKIAAVAYARQLSRAGACRAVACVPTNLYGDRDRFSAEEGHVIASLIVKMHAAKLAGRRRLELWGDGTPRRDFLHASDAARACLVILEANDPPELIHLGTGADYPIKEIAQKVAEAVGFTGEVIFAGGVPSGTPRKLLASEAIRAMGWSPLVSLEEGLRRAYRSYRHFASRDVITEKAVR